MKRHIIVEGPDGAGKDTLIQSLLDYKTYWLGSYIVHERASTSIGGPVPNLSTWIARDVLAMPDLPPSIYNRHPIVSEPIYSQFRTTPDTRSDEERELWEYQPWVEAMRRAVAEHAVLVLCLPSMTRVVATVAAQGPGAHMPGVAANISLIHRAYSDLRWPGIIRYDYTRDYLPALVRRIRLAQRN